MTRFNLLAFAFLLIVGAVGCTERRQSSFLRQADDKISQGRYSEATELLKKAIELDRKSRTAIKALYKLGFTQESYLKDFEGAIGNYQEFVRSSVDRVSIYEVLKRMASIYTEQFRDSDKAIASYKKLISLYPESLEIDHFQMKIAQVYFGQNNFNQARFEYQQLLERYPKSQFNARARFDIGNAYYMEGKYDIAIEAFKQVMRYHSQSEYAVEAQFMMAQCLELQDKLANALQIYENIKDRYPASEVLDMRLGELKKKLGTKK